MTEEELKAAAKDLADVLAEVDGLNDVQYIDEGPLEGEPASIVLEHNGQSFALGVLPV